MAVEQRRFRFELYKADDIIADLIIEIIFDFTSEKKRSTENCIEGHRRYLFTHY